MTDPGLEGFDGVKRTPVRDAALWAWDMFSNRLWSILGKIVRSQIERIPFSHGGGPKIGGGK